MESIPSNLLSPASVAVLIGTATSLLRETHATARCLFTVGLGHETVFLEATGARIFHCSTASLCIHRVPTFINRPEGEVNGD